ncbi:MAG: YbaK/EbsC family protein [Anaerolineales bacterium]
MSDTPLTPDDVQAALRAAGLSAEVQILAASTATAPEAAAAVGTELGSIVKSILFMVDGQPVLVLTAGDQRVYEAKIAKYFETSRKKTRIATPEQCLVYAGYAPGGVPPLGHRQPDALTILIDATLSRYETVYGAAGAHNALFPIRYDDLVRITGGTVLDVVKE